MLQGSQPEGDLGPQGSWSPLGMGGRCGGWGLVLSFTRFSQETCFYWFTASEGQIPSAVLSTVWSAFWSAVWSNIWSAI